MTYVSLIPELHVTKNLWYISVNHFLKGADKGVWSEKKHMSETKLTSILVFGEFTFQSFHHGVEKALLCLIDGCYELSVIPLFSLKEIAEDTIAFGRTPL